MKATSSPLQVKVNALPALCSSGRLQSPSFHFGDATQSASGEELRPFSGTSSGVEALNFV